MKEIRDALAHNAIDLMNAGKDRVLGFGLLQAEAKPQQPKGIINTPYSYFCWGKNNANT